MAESPWRWTVAEHQTANLAVNFNRVPYKLRELKRYQFSASFRTGGFGAETEILRPRGARLAGGSDRRYRRR